tara:strand:- start:590 stop:1054 length:465 start_codon:yes stop_codon:yes gene_type:complete
MKSFFKDEVVVDKSVADIFLDFSTLYGYEARVLTIPTGREDIPRVVVGIQLGNKLDSYGFRTLMYDPVSEELHEFKYVNVEIKDFRRRFRKGGLNGLLKGMTEEKLVSSCIINNYKTKRGSHWHPDMSIDRADEWYHFSGSAHDALNELLYRLN